jgi:lipoprotein signal peptidase
MIAILITLFSVIIDRITKSIAASALKPLGSIPVIKDILHVTYVENTGAAFGMLKDNRWIFMGMSAITIVVIVGYLIYSREKRHSLLTLSLCLILAGGIGNMIDRIFYGYVVDFIDFRLINFAVFNLADTEVSIGAFFLIIYILFIETKKEGNPAGQTNGK